MKRVGIKRLYHEDGRSYSDAEYEAYERKQAEYKAFRIRALKDFGVIFLLCFLYEYGSTLHWNGMIVFKYPFNIALFIAAMSVFNSLIASFMFVFSIRKMKSRLIFLLLSIVTPIYMVIWEYETSYGSWRTHGIDLVVEGDMTIEGLYGALFGDFFYLMPFVALSFFLYNPFKDMKK